MTTVTINSYDPAGRFNMDSEQAQRFFKHVECEAKKAGYDVEFDEALRVDEFSEKFVSDLFEDYEG